MSGEPANPDMPPETMSHFGAVVHEWRLGWRPGVAALIAGSLGYGLYSLVSSLFVEPLQAQFGWSRGDISLVHSFGIVSSFAAPVLGNLTDRFGARPMLSIGLAGSALGYLLLSLMRGSLDYYYAVYFFFSIIGLATTGITCTRILTGAFDRTRGTALALGRSGYALAGALMPLALFPVIVRYGTTGGYLLLAACAAFIALPLAWFWVPSKAAELSTRRGPAPVGSEKWLALITRPKVIILTLAAVCNYAPVVALASQMKPLGVSKGLEAATAVGAVSMMSLAAAIGALISGVLVDRFWAPAVAFLLNAAPAVGCLFLLQDQVPPAVFYGAVLMIGLGQGAEIDIVAYMIARYFGMRSYATIYGITVLGISLGVALAASMIGRIYDKFGNYNIAIMAASASFALAAIFYLLMGRYPAGARPE